MWTDKWPTKPGSYWFYGWRFGNKERNPELSYVEIRQAQNCLIGVTRGHFLYPEEGAIGLWKPCELPQLPNEELL